MLELLTSLIKGLIFFTGSYSNTVFLDPLSREEEEKYIKLLEENAYKKGYSNFYAVMDKLLTKKLPQ